MGKTHWFGMTIGAVLLCTAMVGNAQASPSQVNSGTWTSGGVKHEYALFDDYAVSWEDANAWVNANMAGYHLATITDTKEQAFINAAIFANSGGGEYWLGGYQNPIDTPVANANWAWITGEAWDYTNWSGGEPNDAYGDASEQYLGGNWGEQWNDEGTLGNIAGFVAEKNSVPEPASMLLFGTGLSGLILSGRRRKK